MAVLEEQEVVWIPGHLQRFHRARGWQARRPRRPCLEIGPGEHVVLHFAVDQHVQLAVIRIRAALPHHDRHAGLRRVQLPEVRDARAASLLRPERGHQRPPERDILGVWIVWRGELRYQPLHQLREVRDPGGGHVDGDMQVVLCAQLDRTIHRRLRRRQEGRRYPKCAVEQTITQAAEGRWAGKAVVKQQRAKRALWIDACPATIEADERARLCCLAPR